MIQWHEPRTSYLEFENQIVMAKSLKLDGLCAIEVNVNSNSAPLILKRSNYERRNSNIQTNWIANRNHALKFLVLHRIFGV